MALCLARLKDPLNLQHLLEIESRYPRIQLVIAHIGRAYCPEDVGDAFDLLRTTQRMVFDFSANTNAWVMEQALRAFGPQRLVFGSDLPIVRMRMRRICEGGAYINLVPPGLYGPAVDDPHMREVAPQEGECLRLPLDGTDVEWLVYGVDFQYLFCFEISRWLAVAAVSELC